MVLIAFAKDDLEYLQMEGPLKRLYAWSCVSNNKRAFDVCERICGKWKKNGKLFSHNILQIIYLQELEPIFWQQLCSYVFPGINLTDL